MQNSRRYLFANWPPSAPELLAPAVNRQPGHRWEPRRALCTLGSWKSTDSNTPSGELSCSQNKV
eukprot:2442390-Pyramimonas_sp.AAC.1